MVSAVWLVLWLIYYSFNILPSSWFYILSELFPLLIRFYLLSIPPTLGPKYFLGQKVTRFFIAYGTMKSFKNTGSLFFSILLITRSYTMHCFFFSFSFYGIGCRNFIPMREQSNVKPSNSYCDKSILLIH